MNRKAIRIMENPGSGLPQTSNMGTLNRMHPAQRRVSTWGASTPFPKDYIGKSYIACVVDTGELVEARIMKTHLGLKWVQIPVHGKTRRKIQGLVIGWSEIQLQK